MSVIGMKDFGIVGGSAAAVSGLAAEMMSKATGSAAVTGAVLPSGSEAASIRASETQRGYAADYHAKLAQGIDMIKERGGIIARAATNFAATDAAGGAGVGGVNTHFA